MTGESSVTNRRYYRNTIMASNGMSLAPSAGEPQQDRDSLSWHCRCWEINWNYGHCEKSIRHKAILAMHQTVLLHCLSLPVLLPVSVFLSCSLIFAVPLLRCAHLRVCASSEIMFLLLASSLWRTMICIYVPRFSVMRLVWQMSSQEIIKKQRKRARLGVLCTQSQLSSALQQSALCIFFHHLF